MRRSIAWSMSRYETARKIIDENIDDLHTIARGLLEYETLSGDEIKDLLKGKPPVREFAADVSPRPAPASAVPTAGRGKKAAGPSPIPAAWSLSRTT